MSVTLKVSKLSRWLNALAPCRESKKGNTARSGTPEIQGDRGQTTRRAHVEHGVHGCDAVSVEVQRLIERPCELPSQEERARCGPGDERVADVSGAGSVLGAHVEHPAHVFDSGHIESQRLIER
eukprot:scaffold3455_cov62-Phaeocystis_antarctica.AAC.8